MTTNYCFSHKKPISFSIRDYLGKILGQLRSYPKRKVFIATDCFSRADRSWVMSRIRAKGNISTEVRLARLMRAEGIRGWRRHLLIPGRPDFAFLRQKVAVFVDGCFWHGCPRCFRLPKQNRNYWRKKIEANKRRDRATGLNLRKLGWRVIRLKECSFRNPQKVEKIIRDLKEKTECHQGVSAPAFFLIQRPGERPRDL